jgi:aspartyl aminopeptidase
VRFRIAALTAVAFKRQVPLGAFTPAVDMPTGTTGTRLSARRGILLVDIYLALLLGNGCGGWIRTNEIFLRFSSL